MIMILILQILNPDTSFGYTYHWLSAIGDRFSSDFVIDSLSAGTYILHMSYDSTDGCTTTDTVEITEYTEITSIPNEVDVDCYGDNTGSITATPVGGLAPYTYSWRECMHARYLILI